MGMVKKLLTVEYHSDSETGIHEVGEIDFGIVSGQLDDYLLHYGYKGKNDIIKTLAYLIYAVESKFQEIRSKLDDIAGEAPNDHP